ncbi:MAG: primosomal protein N' [Negativicutes bacterium]|nr:primosomal protein N' [Negativicutes bacterium]
MERIAEVLINIPVKNIARAFSYSVPEQFDFVDAGWRVMVPFGNRKAEGFVISIGPGDDDGMLKPVLDVIDTAPWFTDHMLAVAGWLSDYYLCTPAEAMRLFIPGKAGIKTGTMFRALQPDDADLLTACSPGQRQLHAGLLTSGPRTLHQLTGEYGRSASSILRRLLACDLVAAESVVRKTAQNQYKTFWQLAVSRESAATSREGLQRRPAQDRVLEALLAQDKLTAEDLRRLKISASAVKSLLAAGLITAGQTHQLRDSYAGVGGADPQRQLTEEQAQAVAEIFPAISGRQYRSYLLYGITGSGKTQVYIEAAAQARQMGRQAVVLVPEIALTGQIVTRFKEKFGDDVVVLHSKLSVGERYDTWQRLRAGEAGIVIGARSAVFAPVPDPGVFIIDEEHEFTYKQEESPHYHTRQVALKRAELTGATVIMGSATPAVETYYQAMNGIHRLINLSSRIDGALLPEVTVVDMREELAAGRRSVISQPLTELLEATLSKGEQAIILLNRRGYATFVNCRECGHVMRCDHCAVSLVYHASTGILRCHYCQGSQSTPDVCPACGSRYIRFFGTGTQKVEQELISLLPQARIIRMDQDTTGGKKDHDRILGAFSAGKFDILLGTQMVAKGHDIKNVTAVGIISVDTALNLPDFRAAEKGFALLTQAAGRAGRGDKPGRVVVQTYNPEHYAVVAGAKHDYCSFFEQEVAFRRELFYPPFCQMIKLTVVGGDEIKTRRQAEDMAAGLKNRFVADDRTSVVGPFPAPVAKISDIYRMNILIKTSDILTASAGIRDAGLLSRTDLVIDVDPLNVL